MKEEWFSRFLAENHVRGQWDETADGMVAKINLRYSEMPEKILIELCKTLQENRTVRTLDMEGLKITPEGSWALKEMIERNRALHTLRLGDNGLSHPYLYRLPMALTKNKTLVDVHLRANDTGDLSRHLETAFLGENANPNLLYLKPCLEGSKLDRFCGSNRAAAHALVRKLLSEDPFTSHDLTECLRRRPAMHALHDETLEIAAARTMKTMLGWVEKGQLAEALFDRNGECGNLLNRLVALDLLPELAIPNLWNARPEEGKSVWRAVRHRMSRDIQAQMDAVDTTALDITASDQTMTRFAQRPPLMEKSR